MADLEMLLRRSRIIAEPTMDTLIARIEVSSLDIEDVTHPFPEICISILRAVKGIGDMLCQESSKILQM